MFLEAAGQRVAERTGPPSLASCVAPVFALLCRERSEQLLNVRYTRRLVTMEKVRRYDAEEAAAFHAANPDGASRLDALHELFYAPTKDGEPAVSEAVLAARRNRGKRL